jgi:hypothetical protein
MGKEEWEKILEGFRVEQRGGDGFLAISDRWAVVSTKKSKHTQGDSARNHQTP